jgi:phage terminase large subunit-like protein
MSKRLKKPAGRRYNLIVQLGLATEELNRRWYETNTRERQTDKRSRLIAQSDLFAGGSVRLSKSAPWLEDFTAELLAFPGRHDDQVDALTQGLAWGRSMWSQRARFDRRAVI